MASGLEFAQLTQSLEVRGVVMFAPTQAVRGGKELLQDIVADTAPGESGCVGQFFDTEAVFIHDRII
jgi:hypothetical protein